MNTLLKNIEDLLDKADKAGIGVNVNWEIEKEKADDETLMLIYKRIKEVIETNIMALEQELKNKYNNQELFNICDIKEDSKNHFSVHLNNEKLETLQNTLTEEEFNHLKMCRDILK